MSAQIRPLPALIDLMRTAVAIQNNVSAAAAGAWLAEQTTDDEAAAIMALWHLRHRETVPSAAALDFADAVRGRLEREA